MATSGKGTATVGYTLQIAVNAEHHLTVAHEVDTTATNLRPWCGFRRKSPAILG
jgi:hypothetical protein